MIHVRLNNRILDNRTSFRVFIPLFIWLFVFLGILFTMFATSYYKLVPVLGIEFLCIIPVFFICRKRVNKAFLALDGKFFEADLEIRDRKIYYGKMELKAEYSKKTGQVSLKHTVIAGKYQASALSFWSIVHDEDRDMFLELCDFYHVKIKSKKK